MLGDWTGSRGISSYFLDEGPIAVSVATVARRWSLVGCDSTVPTQHN